MPRKTFGVSNLKSNTFYNPTNPSQEFSNIINNIENTEPLKLVNENNLCKEEKKRCSRVNLKTAGRGDQFATPPPSPLPLLFFKKCIFSREVEILVFCNF